MSANEKQNEERGAAASEGAAEPHAGRHPDESHHLPLFLRDGSEGRKGNAQDEKDETGE